MTARIFVLLGTKKGAFILQSDQTRQSWSQKGPFCETWPMNHVIADQATGTIYAGGGNEWFGPAVWKSPDLGATWTHSSDGLAYEAGQDAITSVWSLAAQGSRFYRRRPARRSCSAVTMPARAGPMSRAFAPIQPHPNGSQAGPA